MVLVDINDGYLLEVWDVVEVESLDGPLDHFEGGKHVDQLVEGAAICAFVGAVLFQDRVEVGEVLADLVAFLEFAVEEGDHLLAQLQLKGLYLPLHLRKYVLEMLYIVLIACLEY